MQSRERHRALCRMGGALRRPSRPLWKEQHRAIWTGLNGSVKCLRGGGGALCVRVCMGSGFPLVAHYRACLFFPNLWPVGQLLDEPEWSADDLLHLGPGGSRGAGQGHGRR